MLLKKLGLQWVDLAVVSNIEEFFKTGKCKNKKWEIRYLKTNSIKNCIQALFLLITKLKKGLFRL